MHRYANKKLLHNRVYFTVPRFKLSQKFCTFCQTLFYHLKLYIMSTKEAVMTTTDIANRFNELAQNGQWNDIQDEMFADNAVSIEPANSPGLKTTEGIKAIKEKGNKFGEMVEEMHGGYSNKPIVAGNHFAVAMGMDVTMKGQGRMKMDEICVYEVKDGQIVKEQFFY